MSVQPLENEIAAVAGSPGRLSNPGRIVMLSTALGVGGGAEEQVMLLSLGLRSRGWKVKIVSLLPLFPLSAELEASDIPISSLDMKRGIPDPRAMLGLVKELRAFRPDVVHCHMPQANLLARAVRPFFSFPVLISTLHNLTMERINGGSGRFLELAHGWTDRYCDLTTVICTPAVKSYVERRAVPADKIAVFYNGVNTQNFNCDPLARTHVRRDLDLEGKFAWLAVGRFERAKAYPNMIRAFAKAAKGSAQDLVLLICGRGSLEEEIRAEIRACGVEERVRFLGVRRDIPDVMNAADAFLMSSYLEGLPMVLLQASSVGMPIVATNVGGNAEVVIDGVNGFVVPPGDDEALAGGMRRVLALPDADRSRMAERGRQHARENFEMERMVDRWETLYLERMKMATPKQRWTQTRVC
jgi:glycosyltransferase involved in cell wall biosynthesis